MQVFHSHHMILVGNASHYAFCLVAVYDRGESKGSSCYRLLSRTGQFIYLKTLGYLELDSQGVVESFICINTLVAEAEGLRLITEMKERYSAMIKANPVVRILVLVYYRFVTTTLFKNPVLGKLFSST